MFVCLNKKNDFVEQRQAMLVRQLEEELRQRIRQPNIELQQQIEALFSENEHLTREIAILRDTIKVSANTNRIFQIEYQIKM